MPAFTPIHARHDSLQGCVMIARRALLTAIAALALAGPATAQSYPARVIKLVVPYTPGSPNDVMARRVTQHLAPRHHVVGRARRRDGAAPDAASGAAARPVHHHR